MSLVNLFLLPISAGMIVLAPEIVVVYLSAKWQAAVLPAQILLVGLTFRSQSRISDAFVNALGVVYQPAWRKGVFAGAVVVGSFLAYRWGIAWVAVAVTLAMILDYVLVLELGIRLTGSGWRDYVVGQVPGVAVSAVLVTALVPVVRLLRSVTPNALVVSVGSVSVGILSVLAIVRLSPAVLGPAGLWFLDQVVQMVPQGSWITRRGSAWLGE